MDFDSKIAAVSARLDTTLAAFQQLQGQAAQLNIAISDRQKELIQLEHERRVLEGLKNEQADRPAPLLHAVES